ncbi:hypothetical protein NT6N_00180 [Oceaniferula spumae]|uniref:Uncharacterized protein n=1 Tax=Oceaniferula spumae TaxID=2979115 RepID=A0AAT9FG69_9BACT
MHPVPPKDSSDDLKDDFSLEQRHPPSESLPNDPATSAKTFFRFIIWISPGPGGLMVLAGINQFFPMSFAPNLLLFAVFTMFIGACDAFFVPGIQNKDGTPMLQPILEHSCKFTFLQILVAPVTMIVLSFGFCAIASFANV